VSVGGLLFSGVPQMCAIRFIITVEIFVILTGGKNTSADWRRTNKNKDWLDFNTPTKADAKKFIK
jgi:hypothetical protein